MLLNEIRDNHGAMRKKLRPGRGEGSGMGKTARRGQKGQKARSGVSINGFEGGQMPLYKRLPKRGFSNVSHRPKRAAINLAILQGAVDAKRLDPKTEVNLETLKAAGLIDNNIVEVKIIARGELKTALNVSVYHASATARAAIVAAKGTLTTTAEAVAI